MCRGDRLVTLTGMGDGDQPGCADWERRLSPATTESADLSRYLCEPSGQPAGSSLQTGIRATAGSYPYRSNPHH